MDEGIEARLQRELGDAYRIDRQLGAGGMGRVFLADDLRHARKVAIKVLRPDLAETTGSERFLREIHIAATLQHPHILALFDSGGAGDALYYVMPYVEGGSLRLRLAREGELPIDEALRILRQIAGALAYAHGRDIVHRDVKPENVLFTGGDVQLADFGIAKALGDRAGSGESLTETGIAVGSPAYLAPEAAANDPAADHRVDLYAFGVLAYEALAGSHPFADASPSRMVLSHLSREVPPLQRARPSVPAELAELVMRCLEKRPADRWQTAAEIAHRLDGILAIGGPAPPVRSHQLSVGRFRLTERQCLRLGRSSLDPRMVGDEIEYLDNGVRSEVLVCFLHGFGLDGGDFEPHLRALPYRGIAPTLYGFEPVRRHRHALPLADHHQLLGDLLHEVMRQAPASTVVLVGFSSGGDMALRFAAAESAEAAAVDGVLALGCNLSWETCFITRIMARFEGGDGTHVLADLRELGKDIATLDEWLSVHAYLVRILRKFQPAAAPLRQLARDIITPFEEDGEHAFTRMYRAASERERALLCVFEDTDRCQELLLDVRLRNADSGDLGERYSEGSLRIEPQSTHFDLLEPERVLRHLDALLALVGPAASRKTAAMRGKATAGLSTDEVMRLTRGER